MPPDIRHAPGDLWVFGYGSLIWKPGFPFEERVEAKLIGAHRALCVLSFDHRGTPEKPGLVFGLDRGGICRGMAYRVAERNRMTVIDYLRAREQTTAVYLEKQRAVWLKNDAERRVEALCYIVDRSHPQYAGRLTLEQQLHYVRQGHGRSGNDRDYVLTTIAALEELGLRDPDLHRLAGQLRGAHETAQ